jgi:hypothetical protein
LVYGAIGEKYDALGGAASWLGLPLADEAPFADDHGRVSVFQHGAIYWWPDLGAIELNDVIFRYTGLHCHSETNDQPLGGGGGADEPYVVLGVVAPVESPNGNTAYNNTARSAIYNDVDAGESRSDSIEIYRGKPYGLTISTLLMEHDTGDPNTYSNAMKAGVGAAATGVGAAIAAIPGVGPALAAVAAPALAAAVTPIAQALNDVLGTGDDKIAQVSQTISAKDMIQWARKPDLSYSGVNYKFQTELLRGGDGGNYRVYFGIAPA